VTNLRFIHSQIGAYCLGHVYTSK